MITVALITYNRPQYLKEAINGILNQTYKDFELLICDNGSDLETQTIIKSFDDKRIKIVRNEVNNIEFYNYPFSIPTREFLLITHDDDIMLENFLTEMLEKIINSNLAAIACNCEIIDENSKSNGKNLLKLSEELLLLKDNYFKHYFKQEVPPCPTVIMRKSFFDIHKIKMDFSVGRAADMYMWYQVIDKCGGEIGILNKVLYKYRVHSSQDSNINSGILECDLFEVLLREMEDKYVNEKIKILYRLRNIYKKNRLNSFINKKCISIFRELKYSRGIEKKIFFWIKYICFKERINSVFKLI